LLAPRASFSHPFVSRARPWNRRRILSRALLRLSQSRPRTYPPFPPFAAGFIPLKSPLVGEPPSSWLETSLFESKIAGLHIPPDFFFFVLFWFWPILGKKGQRERLGTFPSPLETQIVLWSLRCRFGSHSLRFRNKSPANVLPTPRNAQIPFLPRTPPGQTHGAEGSPGAGLRCTVRSPRTVVNRPTFWMASRTDA